MSAEHPGEPLEDAALVAHAAALYPGNAFLQVQWLRGVRFVRTTARGWLLDPPPMPPAIARVDESANLHQPAVDGTANLHKHEVSR